MPVSPGLDTTQRTIVKASPNPLSYRRLTAAPGEPHLQRRDLLSSTSSQWQDGHKLARLVHITDFQVADLASPSRVEFLQRFTASPEWRRMLPAYRPQEFMLTQAIESIVRTVRRLAADPASVDFVVTTGDNTDSAQENELDVYLTLMDGGEVDPGDGNAGLADTPTASGDVAYWNPEPSSRDEWKTRRGYPEYAGAVEAAAHKFTAAGLGIPWLTCFGNHDCLVQGRAQAPVDYDDFLTGRRKPVSRPTDRDPGPDALNEYCNDPYWVSSGPTIPIEPRANRRMVTKTEYVNRHFETGGTPLGHGFTPENQEQGTAYYTYDELPGLRVISLDTTNPEGHVDGCVDETQYRWLESRLQEVHSSHLNEHDLEVHPGNEDRLVIICSHHGLSTMTNGTSQAAATRPRLADDMEKLLHRYPNVVLWLSGHTHVNRATPRRRAAGGGFWEVSTSSIAEWPVQLRSLSLNIVDDLGVRIRSTMIDSDAPISPTGGTDLANLASLHREAAANDPYSVGGLDAQGLTEDRNVDLLVPLSPLVVSRIMAALPERQDAPRENTAV